MQGGTVKKVREENGGKRRQRRGSRAAVRRGQREGNGGASAGPRRRAPSELFHAVPPARLTRGKEAFLAFADRIRVCAIY